MNGVGAGSTCQERGEWCMGGCGRGEGWEKGPSPVACRSPTRFTSRPAPLKITSSPPPPSRYISSPSPPYTRSSPSPPAIACAVVLVKKAEPRGVGVSCCAGWRTHRKGLGRRRSHRRWYRSRRSCIHLPRAGRVVHGRLWRRRGEKGSPVACRSPMRSTSSPSPPYTMSSPSPPAIACAPGLSVVLVKKAEPGWTGVSCCAGRRTHRKGLRRLRCRRRWYRTPDRLRCTRATMRWISLWVAS